MTERMWSALFWNNLGEGMGITTVAGLAGGDSISSLFLNSFFWNLIGVGDKFNGSF